ncbi:MAG: HAMP domain-containing protein [Acidobacteria bacterium]|nr:HAMP domain-containing protein [Acidobacteriota bacterium]
MIRLGVRAKFFLYSNALIIITMAAATFIAISFARSYAYGSIERRGRSITEALAIPITDALMYEDLGLVAETGLTDNYISEMIRRNGDLVIYAIVADPSGRVTHSNDWSLLGRTFERALRREDIEEGSVVERRVRGEEAILEVRAPLNISSKYWGSLAMGFSLAKMNEQVRAIGRNAVIAAGVLILLNSLMTMVYVESLLRPLLALLESMRRAATGDLAARATERGGGEVTEVGRAFNRMMDELEESRERDKVRSSHLAHMEKMAAVGTLAAGVAHEVNNPLGGILTCIENIRANPEDKEMQARYLDLMQDGLQRIGRTVSNLLDFSRQREIRPEPTSINHNLRHAAELTAFQMRRAGVEVVWDLDPDEPVVMADHFQMEQLFLNLYLNALQAMPEGGVLTLRTRVKDGYVIAEVQDTGMGMTKETLERIFDPFFTTREVGKGTGLGLTVSDSIVAAHGGVISVLSEVGSGSVFRVSLPSMDAARRGEEASR